MQEHEHGKDDFNFDKVTEHIYIGNNQCCRITLDKLLLSEGIYADLSLEENVLDTPIGAKAYLWLPMINNTAPKIEQIRISNSFIESIVESNNKIYVHCQNGHGRAPSVVIAYLMYTGFTYEDAYALVKEKRPVIHLDAEQVEFLKHLRF